MPPPLPHHFHTIHALTTFFIQCRYPAFRRFGSATRWVTRAVCSRQREGDAAARYYFAVPSVDGEMPLAVRVRSAAWLRRRYGEEAVEDAMIDLAWLAELYDERRDWAATKTTWARDRKPAA